MSEFDLVIRNGTVATASETFVADIGVKGGTIASIARGLSTGRQDIDAAGKLVLPGGIDSHCHVEQLSSMGILTADDFYSATAAAACGGTTTIIPFAAQQHGESLRAVVDDYHKRAGPKAVIDYAFHTIISDLTPQVLGQDLPALIEAGYTSFKVYMTYERLKLEDYQLLQLFALAKREGAMAMIHAENNDIIRYMTDVLLAKGQTAPKYHAVSHHHLAESEATYRAISLAELAGTPLLVVHVSDPAATESIRRAQTRGLRVFGETCPQYLFLTADDIDRPGMEGAKFCCSPPPRDRQAQEAIWQGIVNGTFQIFSSDHAPYRFDETAKIPKGSKTVFKEIANGVPGIEVRLALLFSEGVLGGRIDINRFVALTSTNHAKLYGLYPRKGTLAIGSDADIAVWDPHKKLTIRHAALHDNVGYTPYEGREIVGWPEKVFSRGELVVSNGALNAKAGRGRFYSCDRLSLSDGPTRSGPVAATNLTVARPF